MTHFQSTALNSLGVWIILLAIIVMTYLTALKQPLWKKLLACSPSLIFMIAPVVLIASTPEPNYSASFGLHDDVVAAAYLVALAIIVLNVFYIRTWLHFVQILNISLGAATLFVSAIAVSGDSL